MKIYYFSVSSNTTTKAKKQWYCKNVTIL